MRHSLCHVPEILAADTLLALYVMNQKLGTTTIAYTRSLPEFQFPVMKFQQCNGGEDFLHPLDVAIIRTPISVHRMRVISQFIKQFAHSFCSTLLGS